MNYDKHKVKELLHNYYEGKTSLSEEQYLSDYFNSPRDLGDLERYRAEFKYCADLRIQKTNKDFSIKNIDTPQLKTLEDRLSKKGFSLLHAAAGFILFVVGFGVGKTFPESNTDTYRHEIGLLRQETQQLRSLMISSLTNHPFASQRIQGIKAIGHHYSESNDKILILLGQYLNEDDNLNVRLASIQVLSDFEQTVLSKKIILNALEHQDSPMIIIGLLQLIKDFAGNDKEVDEALQKLKNQRNLDIEIEKEINNMLNPI
ncbi:MAG: hypothetical protein AAF039_10990 [Bacteroidota bacterium]